MAKAALKKTATAMKPYFYRGTCTPRLVKYILANPLAFSRDMARSVEAFGGEVLNCKIDATSADPIGFLMFPTDISARSWNIKYASRKDVATSHIFRLLDDEDLMTMGTLIKGKRPRKPGGGY